MIRLGRVSKKTRGVERPGYVEDLVEFQPGQYIKYPPG
jgi:hypothetical protein